MDASKIQYSFQLTNMKEMFVENIQTNEFSTKFVNLNSDLEDCDLTEGLNEIEMILSDVNKSEKVNIIESADSQMKIDIEWSSEGIPFRWVFDLERTTDDIFQANVTCALTSTISVLLDQRENLFKLLREKDLEIEDYLNSGSKLSRKSLKTDWFLKEKFLENSLESSEFKCKSSIEVMSSLDVKVILEKLGEDDQDKNTRKATEVEDSISEHNSRKGNADKKTKVDQAKCATYPKVEKRKLMPLKASDNEKRRKTNHLKKL